MDKRQVISLLACIASMPALAALQAGTSAPAFTAQASLAGKPFTFSLKEALAKGPVVVYFYPSAYTGGCDLQAHTFAVNKDKFTAAGATIVGVSLDSIQRLNDFSADPNFCAGKFPTASDADGSIAKSYELQVRQGPPGLKDVRGVEIGHDFVERTTFVLTHDGKVAETITGVAPDKNVEQALDAVQHLTAKAK
ncbi:MAG TPA: peroxiredoxin [Steroidobacteraceae bacterium]|jgi:peroxiredoxin Q/BCP|nr:peroxiredoxin [Steroidobacteraceae bacterium]